MTHAVVIGGGIAGLASAALLAKDGYRVTLFEGRDELGGRAGTWERDGFRFDTGPSWYLMPEVFDHFFRLMGTTAAAQLELVSLDPGYRVFFEGEPEPIDIAGSREANLDLFELIEPGSRPRMERYLASAKETYEIAKLRFLYTSFESIRPLLRADVLKRIPRLARLLLQPLARRVEHTVTDPRLRQVLGYPAVFLGSSPYLAPSMYHLMSHLDLEGGVMYPMGGFVRLIDSIAGLAATAGVVLRTGAEVTSIEVVDGKATGVRIGGELLTADLVVSAADLHHSETGLLPAELQTYPQEYWDDRVPGPSALLILLGVEGELPELLHHSLFFAKDWREGFDRIFGAETSIPDPASLYVCKPSGIDPSVAPAGQENLFVLVPIPADPSIGRGDVDGDGTAGIEALADRVIRQIGDWSGIQDLGERIVLRRTIGPGDFAADLHSWRGTALGPAHTLRQSAMFRAGNASTKVDGLYYVGGSTIPGIGLPMCLISAEILLKRLRGDTSTEPMPEPLKATIG
ncbi:phytoene desaturase family protein [soil metagenome]